MNDADKLTLRQGPDGAVIAVKVVPGASRDRVVGVLGDCLKIVTAAAPEKGKANAAVADLLAATLGVDRRDVRLIAGATRARKEFRVATMSADQVRQAIADA